MPVRSAVAYTDVTVYLTLSGAPMYAVMSGAETAYALAPQSVAIHYRSAAASERYEPLRATVTGFRVEDDGHASNERVSGWLMLGLYAADDTPPWIRDLAETHRPAPMTRAGSTHGGSS